MAYTTSFVYIVLLCLSAFPNSAIVSHINEKPILTKVLLDHHHKDTIVINWAMSTILTCFLIFLNIPGYHETYSETTKLVLDVLIRKGIGLFVFALLTSFLISAALHYMQKFQWAWLCEHDDERMLVTVRAINATFSISFWIAWIACSTKFNLGSGIKMDIVQSYAAVCLFLYLVIHLAIETRKCIQRRHMESLYNHMTGKEDIVVNRSILGFRSVSFVSAFCAAAVVLFVIMAENPKSIQGAAFIFAASTSIGFPTIFILGNRTMRRQCGKNAYKRIVHAYLSVKGIFIKSSRPNKVANSSDVSNA